MWLVIRDAATLVTFGQHRLHDLTVTSYRKTSIVVSGFITRVSSQPELCGVTGELSSGMTRTTCLSVDKVRLYVTPLSRRAACVVVAFRPYPLSI